MFLPDNGAVPVPMIRISVIIVSYNTRDLLLDCLSSVYASEGDLDLEVFVVDNASSDGSVDVVGEYFPECTVIAGTENVGFSKANNKALRIATGDYILLLNPDTIMDANVLAAMTAYMEQNPDVGMCSCKLVLGDGSLDLACRRSFPSFWDGFCRAVGLSALFPRIPLFTRYNLTHLNENETYPVDAVNGAFMFTRREAVEEVGFLDEDYFMYAEDLDWCFRFGKAGWKVMYHPVATTVHFKGQSSKARSSAMIREMFKSTKLFYRKHYYPSMSPTKRFLMTLGLEAWKRMSLVKNAMRAEKRTRP
jgi:GT2 family glycosyltransferase